MSHEFDIGLACLNGHSINGNAGTMPQFSADFCQDCGAPTTAKCSHCQTAIRGSYLGAAGIGWDPPKFCHACGKPYPWTERATEALSEAIGELDNLPPGEANKLIGSIPDVLSETQKTDLAVGRFQKAIAKGGKIGGKLVYDTLVKVGSEAFVKLLMGG